MAVVMSYWMLLVIIPLLAVFLYAQHYYAKTARQIESMVWAGAEQRLSYTLYTIANILGKSIQNQIEIEILSYF